MMRAVFVLLALCLLFACASQPPQEDSATLMAKGRYEEGIARLEQAVKEHPKDLKRRTDLINMRERTLNRLVNDAVAKRMSGGTEEAALIYQRVLRIDPTNERAKTALYELDRDRRHADTIRDAKEALAGGNAEGAWLRVQSVLRENPGNRQAQDLRHQLEDRRARELASAPTLKSMYDGHPINMAFRDADVRFVFEALSRESDVTFVFERDVRPDLRTTIVARNISFEDAVDLLLMSNQLEKKIINRRTVLVYPSTTEKLRQYQDLAVKGFYLTYADVKQTAEMIKAVVNSKEMFVDEKMNLIVLRDTPDAIGIAEKLVAMHDLVAPEVMLDVEVLEVQRNKLVEMGVQWPNRLTLSPLNGDGTTLKELGNITSATTRASLADMIINLNKETGLVNTLANPRIRSQNRQKANILIGNKVPVVTTTATATGFASQSVQYLDVGLKLEIEPSIHLQDEVEIKLALEVSNIVSQVVVGDVLTYQIGTRNAAATLRMKDGETQVLAGLINDNDTRNSAGVPGLSDLPIVGRLFRSQRDVNDKTEIVLLITPHLVRNVTLPDATASEFLSGSEANLRSPRAAAAADVPVQAAAKASPEVVAKADTGVKTDAAAATRPEPAKATAPGAVRLAWSGPQAAKVGDQFKLAVVMRADSPLHSVPMQLSFDPALLKVVDVTEGGFFRQGGAKSSFAHRIDENGGRVILGASRSDNNGSSGEAQVATITFRAQAPRPRTEIRLDSVTAITPEGAAASVSLPPPFGIAIGN